jgi:hypothetical protein
MSTSINVRMAKVPDELTSREIRAILASILTDLDSLKTSHNQLLTDYNAHDHGGVTAGSASSDPAVNSTAVAVSLNTSS